MTGTWSKFSLVTLALAGVAILLAIEHHAQLALRAENQTLRARINELTAENLRLSKHSPAIPHLPPPVVNPLKQTRPAVDDTPTHTARPYDAEPAKLTAAQVDAYLKAHGRRAATLLAAYRTSGDPALLKEAMEKFPDDPQVAFEAAESKDLSPDQQRQWLDAFKKAAPDNALAKDLSALNYFNAGQLDEGLQELAAADGNPMQDYTAERVQNDMEAYLSAGYSPAEAERMAQNWLLLPQCSQIKQLGQDLASLANAYSQSGDQASAFNVTQMTLALGQSFANEPNSMLLDQLVGLAVQKLALNGLDPGSVFGDSGQTVQDLLNQIAQQRLAIKTMVDQAVPLLPALSDQDLLIYENRRLLFGELAAMQWLVDQNGAH